MVAVYMPTCLRVPYPPGGLPEDLGGGVQRASGNPYPISDQNMCFPPLFQT